MILQLGLRFLNSLVLIYAVQCGFLKLSNFNWVQWVIYIYIIFSEMSIHITCKSMFSLFSKKLAMHIAGDVISPGDSSSVLLL